MNPRNELLREALARENPRDPWLPVLGWVLVATVGFGLATLIAVR